ncbi:MAG: hypothetical protein K2W82_17930 [Candidatus Obscuribacterales bacterium]|jgi:hypothetical protein|nr:hypothetical protein [Candidatus Obscuribacterales bacterium]
MSDTRTIYLPLKVSAAQQLAAAPANTSLRDKLTLAECLNSDGIRGAKTEDDAHWMGETLGKEDFCIVQITIGDDILGELSRQHLMRTPCAYAQIIGKGVELLLERNANVSFSSDLKEHKIAAE